MSILFPLILSLFSYGGELASGHREAVVAKKASSGVVELAGCQPLKIPQKKKKTPGEPNNAAQGPTFEEQFKDMNKDRADFDEVLALYKKEKEGISEESFARKKAEEAGLSREEILARLIYSESISSGYWNNKCNAPSGEAVMESVGWGIMNRVKAKLKKVSDGYSEAIFEKKQFRTSFSQSEKSFAIDFLCPLKAQAYLNQGSEKRPNEEYSAEKLYQTAQNTAKKIIEKYEDKGIPKDYQNIGNFFYPESDFMGHVRPTWAPKLKPEDNVGYMNILKVAEKPCVEFYRK